MCEPSVGAMLAARVDQTPESLAFMIPDRVEGPNTWSKMSWREAQTQVHRYAAGLLSLGLELEQRVAIASSTRIEWVFADLAIACAGGATTTIYPNTSGDDLLYIITDSDSRVLIAENREQVAKVQQYDELNDQLTHVVVIDDDGAETDRDDSRVLGWGELASRGDAHLVAHPNCVRDAIEVITPEHLSTLIYTSGTTGRPKGVELTQECWTYQGHAMDSLRIIDHQSLQYLWLPLSHVFGKALIAAQVGIGFASAVDGRIDRIVVGLGEVHPTFMCGAPRIFEKVRAAVLTASPARGIKGRIARWAFSVGRRSIPYRLEGRKMPKRLAVKYALGDKLVFSKLKEKMGGNIEFFMSGSAKLSPQVQEWFYAAGILVVEGYGSTETSAIASVNHPREPRFGTVGPVTPGVDIKIADDGEVLLKGPIITRGYHNNLEATEECFTDGFFHTGDVGKLDDDGFLRITDRKKDLIKTSGGKYVAPQKVESVIMANIPYLSQAVVVGEGHKYCVALVTLDEANLLKWGAKHGHHESYAELSQLPEIHQSIDRFLQRANKRLERWETIKRFAILDHELSVEDGGTTPNMKIRRSHVSQKYSDLIDELYGTEDSDSR